jgi:pilus assembly protein Flp/PilA
MNMSAYYLKIRNWLQREEGQDLLEYAMLAALIAVIAVTAVGLFGTNVSTFFNDLATTVGGW